MKKPLTVCVNGDGRPVQPPSWVLCKECFANLDAQFKSLRRVFDNRERETQKEPK